MFTSTSGCDTDPAMLKPWPLVGRAAELADVADAMDLGAGGVLFAGPAGVGKTRLATECLTLAEDRGWASAVVRANRAVAAIPYGAFAPLLPAAFRSTEGEADSLRQAAHAILGDTDDHRLLILVDDAHELDDASAALVHLLATSPQVFLVVTVRTGADVPDPVPSLWKDELLERIEVPTLDADAAAELVSAAVGGTVDGVSAHALWLASGGNALFLRELVIGARDAGALCDVGGGLWRLTGTLSPSTRLGEVVGLRLGALTDDEREVVEFLAVGEPVSLDDLVALVQASCVDELERRGLLEVQIESRRRQVRMAHPLFGEVVRAGLPERRRQEIFGRLADRLEAHGAKRREDVLRVAVWRLDAGGGGRPGLLVAAARQAHAAHDIALGVRLAQAALANGAGADAAHILGVGLDDLGDHEQAEEVLRAGEEAATDPRARARLSLSRADNLFRGLGRADEAEAIVQAAEQLVADDVVLRDGLVALRATFLLFEGRLTDAIHLVEPLLDAGTDIAYAQGALAGSVALSLGGRPNEAVVVAERGERARVALGEQVQLAAPGIYLVARAQALLEAGQMRAAAELAQLGYDGAVEIGAPHGQAWFASILGRIDLHRGKAASAARWSREGGVVWRALRHPAARWGFGALASAQALAGDLVGAEAAYAELDAEPPTPVRMFDPEIDRGRASVAVQRGERTRPRPAARSASPPGRSTTSPASARSASRCHGSTPSPPTSKVTTWPPGSNTPTRSSPTTATASTPSRRPSSGSGRSSSPPKPRRPRRPCIATPRCAARPARRRSARRRCSPSAKEPDRSASNLRSRASPSPDASERSPSSPRTTSPAGRSPTSCSSVPAPSRTTSNAPTRSSASAAAASCVRRSDTPEQPHEPSHRPGHPRRGWRRAVTPRGGPRRGGRGRGAPRRRS